MLKTLRKRPLGRGGGKKRPSVPERTCIASGQKLTQPEMVRFVLSSEGRVTPDIDCKLPGRGIWVASNRHALERACDRKLFARAARKAVEVPADLPDRVEISLVNRVFGLLALARKSGLAVAGFERVREQLAAGEVGLLLQASDGSSRQIGKIATASGNTENCRCLTAAELGMAFGRQSVVHVAVKAGKLAGRVRVEVRRLAGFRGL